MFQLDLQKAEDAAQAQGEAMQKKMKEIQDMERKKKEHEEKIKKSVFFCLKNFEVLGVSEIYRACNNTPGDLCSASQLDSGKENKLNNLENRLNQ